MRSNSLLNAILTLRSQVRESAISQGSFLSEILTNEGAFTNCTVTTSKGVAYAVSRINDVYNFVGQDGEISNSFSITTLEDGIDLDASFDSHYASVKEFIADVSESTSFNQAVDAVSTLFTTSPNVDIITIRQVIKDSCTDADNDSVRQLSALLSANTVDGKVSQYTFLNIIKNAYNNRDTQGNGLEVDNTSAFFIKNAIGTIIASIMQVFLEIVSMVVSMINVVVGAILAVFTALIGKITEAINNATDLDVELKDPESSSNFFDGVLLAGSGSLEAIGLVNPILASNQNYAMDIDFGPLRTYLWAQEVGADNYVGKIGINCFLQMALHPLRTIKAICESSQWNISVGGGFAPSGHVTYTVPVQTSMVDFVSIINNPNNNCYLTLEELSDLKFAPSSSKNSCALFNRAILEFIMLRFKRNDTKTVYSEVYWNPTSGIPSGQYSIACIQIINRMIMEYKLNGTVDDYLHEFGASNAAAMLTDIMIQSLSEWSNQYAKTTTDASTGYRWNRTTTINVPQYGGGYTNLTTYYVPLGLLTNFTSDASFSFADGVDYIIVDNIPRDRTWSFANATWSDVVTACLIVTAISAAAIVTVAVGKAQLKKLSFKCKVKSMAKLQQARNACIDSDTGALKYDPSGQLMKNYYKAVKSYNLKGKFLGWGYYDATNNWVNSPENSSSPYFDASSIITLIKG